MPSFSGDLSAHELILASGSPRRADLLSEHGYTFQIIRPEVEELHDAGTPILELTLANAALKARYVAGKLCQKNAVIIAADTLVTIDGEAITKPADLEEARGMLRRLSGREHEVTTAVCLFQCCDKRLEKLSVTTNVRFKTLSDEEITQYFKNVNPLDKAGAYGAQEHADLIIAELRGSYTNVVGLPMEEVSLQLAGMGVVPSEI